MARKRDVLSKLALISDARSGAAPADTASTIGTRGDGTKPEHGRQIPGVNGRGYADTQFPPDFDANCLDRTGPPPKTFSLYAHYRFLFDAAAREVKRATSDTDRAYWLLRTDSLCSMALRDLLQYQGKLRRPLGRTDAENVQELLTEYRGIPAHEAAVWLMCSVVWVRKSRQLSGVDPELGEEALRDGRMLKILQLREAGMSQREIAREIGVSAMTVSRALAAA